MFIDDVEYTGEAVEEDASGLFRAIEIVLKKKMPKLRDSYFGLRQWAAKIIQRRHGENKSFVCGASPDEVYDDFRSPPNGIYSWDWKTYGYWLQKNESWPSGHLEAEEVNLVLAEEASRAPYTYHTPPHPPHTLFYFFRLKVLSEVARRTGL